MNLRSFFYSKSKGMEKTLYLDMISSIIIVVFLRVPRFTIQKGLKT